MKITRTLLVGATVATLGLATVTGVGLANAATDNSSTDKTSIVDKIAEKFNLNKDEVQAVFDEEREEHIAQHKANLQQRLDQAVQDKKLTQEQADHIKKTLDEIDTLRGDKSPRDLDDSTRQQIKDKLDELRQWAEDNNIDARYVLGGHGMGGRGHGHHGPDFDEPGDEGADQSEDGSGDDKSQS